ncbi:toprim domain-containing protein [Symbiopectobacterium sp. Eva_TO]
MTTFVDDIRLKANGHWEPILERLGISTNRKEGECPHCGGKTRYRFDDLEGRGTYLCSHCGAGTGLDLVMKVKQCTAPEAATMVAEVMAIPLNQQEKPKKPAKEKPLRPIAERVAALVKDTHMGESVYLNNKGLQGPHSLFNNGSILLPLRTIDGVISGAHVIGTDGRKRLIAGSKKKGAFIPLGDIPQSTETVLIAEGYATALTVKQIRPDAFTVAAMDADNLLPVAKVIREKYPAAKIIIAADNDIKPSERNKGKERAESAATAVSGWVTLPPTDHKADWNDYRQQNGLEAATLAFNEGLSHFTPYRYTHRSNALFNQ